MRVVRSVRLLAAGVLLSLAPAVHAADCVVLLHGLLRTSASMQPMEQALTEAGYAVVNVDYPSRDHELDVLATLAVEAGLGGCRVKPGEGRIHFVTHSLGGILVRQYLASHDIPELGRVVMLAPPNQGTVAVDALRDVPGFDWMNGPVGAQMGKGEDSAVLALGPADFELGVIAGNRTIDPITSAVLPDPDDGRVSVEDTKLEGMRDFIVVEHSHAFIMRMPRTIELTMRFLGTGRFSAAAHQAGERPPS
jgi:pimeloyl-ACP methyl ester carboxylesterase